MSTVSALRKRFAEEQQQKAGVISTGPSTGGKPPPPRKPRPTSSHFGGTTTNGASSNHLTTPSQLAARNSNNILPNNHQRNSHQLQHVEQEDVYDNELPSDPAPAAPISNARTFQQPSFSPEPPQRKQPPPPARNTTPSWNNVPSSGPPPVPQTARPESASLASPPTNITRPNFGGHVQNNHVVRKRSSTEDHATSVEYTTAGKGLTYELCTDLQQNFEEMPDYFDARSGTSRLGFGTDLQDRPAHDSILRLNDHELKLLDTLKKVIQHKIKSDRDYASALAGIGKLSTQFNAESSITHSSCLVKSWTSFVKETDSLSKLIRQHADEMSNALVEKLNLIIREKGDAKRQYMRERDKTDQDFIKAKDEVRDNLSRYHKCAKDTKDAKTKYEECQNKGRNAKDIDKAKDRYKKAVIKLHRAHNEYVLSLKAASLHQEHYRTSILPRLLECLQQTQESQVAQVKQMLVDMGNLSNTSSGEFVTSHNNIMRGIAEIRPDQEYLDFVASNKCDPPPVESFDFDITPMQEFAENLEENAVVLNKLTLESFQHLHTSLETQLKDLQQNHKDKKQELQSLDEEIRAIQPSTSEEGVLDLISKQKAYRDVSREIQDLRCQEAKVHVQHQMLDVKLSVVENEDDLTDGIELMEPPMSTLSRKSTSVSQLDSDSGTTKSKAKRLPFTIKKMFPAQSRSHEEQTRDLPLDEEIWYHGALPRTDAEVHLFNDGDFLVREKSDASGQIVLSARAEGRVRHFPIQKNAESMYRLEGEAFPTVGELIRHQLTTGTPVTKASQAILTKPIARVRDEHDMRHEEIDLGDKLGAGHFGDVFRGTKVKDGSPVAVKTCKETVDASTRRKFLKEANILKQYNHANIVKLIGVCTDKHPIYIVMELVPGGDLLTFLRKDNTELNAKQMTRMGEDAAAGMSYLESKNCIHRDLAARNCLVGLKNVIKISDFGMSRQEELYTIEHGTMRQIPIKWTAPEAMNFGTYTTMSDVWSFGILLWEVFSHGSTPYPGMNNNEAREKVEQSYRMPSPQGCQPDIYELMLRCWKYEASDRPKFKEIHTILKTLAKKMK